MNMYALRVDLDKVEVSAVISALSPYMVCYGFCLELGAKGTNKHMHLVCESTYNAASLRLKLRGLGLKGNGSYSLSKCKDLVKYLAYIMKEGDFQFDEVFLKNYSEELELAKKYMNEVKAEMKEGKKKVNKLDDLYNYCLDKLGDGRYDKVLDVRKKVFILLIDKFLEEGVLIRSHQLKCYIDTILCKLNPSYRYDMYNDMYRN